MKKLFNKQIILILLCGILLFLWFKGSSDHIINNAAILEKKIQWSQNDNGNDQIVIKITVDIPCEKIKKVNHSLSIDKDNVISESVLYTDQNTSEYTFFLFTYEYDGKKIDLYSALKKDPSLFNVSIVTVDRGSVELDSGVSFE